MTGNFIPAAEAIFTQDGAGKIVVNPALNVAPTGLEAVTPAGDAILQSAVANVRLFTPVGNLEFAATAGNADFAGVNVVDLSPQRDVNIEPQNDAIVAPVAGDVRLLPIVGNVIVKPIAGATYLDKLRGQDYVVCGRASLGGGGNTTIGCADVAAGDVILVTAYGIPAGKLYVANIIAGISFDIVSDAGVADSGLLVNFFRITPAVF